MNSQQFRKAAHAAIEEIIKYYDTIEDRRVASDVSPGYLKPLVPSAPPEDGEQWPAIQADIERIIIPGLTHWQSPKFMAFFPASSTYPGILGEMYSAAFTAPAFNWLCSPAVTELETVMMDWLAKLLALPECFMSNGEGGGVIQGSASETVVTTMVAARERIIKKRTSALEGVEQKQKVAELRGNLVALCSSQSHSSTQKAAIIAGTHNHSVPARASDSYALTGNNLRHALEYLISQDLVPYFVTVTLGTTSTCAIDNFAEIAEVLKDYPDIWVHVDAAYAGAALVCEEYQHLTKEFHAFDSFNVNLHKWLLVNFDASCLFVKRRRELTATLSVTPSYLRNDYSESGLVTDYRDWQIPLGRRFRSLKVWFVFRTYGKSGVKNHIRRHVRLGEDFHKMIQSRPDLFEVLAGPAFALTVITIIPRSKVQHGNKASSKGKGDEVILSEANAVTKEVYEKINSQGEIYLTSTVVDGIYAIRVVSANPQAQEKYVRQAFEILVKTTEDIRESHVQNHS